MATKTVSVLTGGTNSHQTSATEVNNIATDFIAQGVVGVIGLNTGSGGTGSFAVSAQASPGMSVRVTQGQAYVTGTPTGGTSQTVRVSMDTFEDVTIAANATGGTRYDWIYIKLDPDKMVNPAVDASDVATLLASRSTSSATDNGTPPTYGYCLGVVTVANGASSITNANITDSRKRTGANMISDAVTIPSTTVVSTASLTNPYKFLAYPSANFTSASAAVTKMPLNAEVFDTGNNFDSSTNYRFTAPVAGFYFFHGQMTTTTTRTQLTIFKNGSEIARGNDITTASTNNNPNVSAFLQLAANDYIELHYYTASAVTINAGASGSLTYFSGFLVSTT